MDFNRIDEIIENHGRSKVALISILQEVQEECKWLPREALVWISQRLDIPLVQTYGIATFYKAFRLNPVGKNQITVCTGTACHVRGTSLILAELKKRLGIRPGETTPDRLFSLETVRCLGSCGLGPIMVVNGSYYGRTSVKDVSAVLTEIRRAEETIEPGPPEEKVEVGQVEEVRAHG